MVDRMCEALRGRHRCRRSRAAAGPARRRLAGSFRGQQRAVALAAQDRGVARRQHQGIAVCRARAARPRTGAIYGVCTGCGRCRGRMAVGLGGGRRPRFPAHRHPQRCRRGRRGQSSPAGPGLHSPRAERGSGLRAMGQGCRTGFDPSVRPHGDRGRPHQWQQLHGNSHQRRVADPPPPAARRLRASRAHARVGTAVGPLPGSSTLMRRSARCQPENASQRSSTLPEANRSKSAWTMATAPSSVTGGGGPGQAWRRAAGGQRSGEGGAWGGGGRTGEAGGAARRAGGRARCRSSDYPSGWCGDQEAHCAHTLASPAPRIRMIRLRTRYQRMPQCPAAPRSASWARKSRSTLHGAGGGGGRRRTATPTRRRCRCPPQPRCLDMPRRRTRQPAAIESESPHIVVPEIEAIRHRNVVDLERDPPLRGRETAPPRAARWDHGTARGLATMDREGIRRLAPETLGLRPRSTASSTRMRIRAAVAAIGLPRGQAGDVVVRQGPEHAGAGRPTSTTLGYAPRGGRSRRREVIVEGFVDFDYEITL